MRNTAGTITTLKTREAKAHEDWQEEAVRREGISAQLDTLEAQLTDQKLALLELERELLTAQGGLKDREEARVADGREAHADILVPPQKFKLLLALLIA